MSAFACFHFQGYNDYSDQYHQKQFERIYLDFHT